MVVAFGEIRQEIELPGGGVVIETAKVRDYKQQHKRRYYTEDVLVSDYSEVRQEIDRLIAIAESGNCLDMSIEIRVDKRSLKPKLIKKTHLDISSCL